MLRRSTFLMEKMPKLDKQHKDLMVSFRRKRAFRKRTDIELADEDGDRLKGRGREQRKQREVFDEMGKMESPIVWLWYPWRVNPEPPVGFPKGNALKNLHGAIYRDLSPAQKKREASFLYGAAIDPARDEKHEAAHPFLAKLLKDMDGQAKGFPFWYKKYPTRRHAYETRFNIPKEMLDGYSEDMKKAVSREMMTTKEAAHSEKARYTERYAQHPLDTSSPAVVAVSLAVECRQIRNHLLNNPANNVWKARLAKKERTLNRILRRLRKLDFKQYWEILRDHDVQDIIQPPNAVRYRWGNYWEFDWNNGVAISTNVADFMDPRGLNGCVETGRSRAEVARDLGLSYTRTMSQSEQRQLSRNALYYENLRKFKNEQPEAWREKSRTEFIRKFTGMFSKLNKQAFAYDFPSKNRRVVGTKYIRWKSARHGPM